jgi:hypothetical protein
MKFQSGFLARKKKLLLIKGTNFRSSATEARGDKEEPLTYSTLYINLRKNTQQERIQLATITAIHLQKRL